MNICVISNSHAASLKGGWDAIRYQYPNIDMTFFAAPNMGMTRVLYDPTSASYVTKNAKVRGMLSMTSGGYDHIELEDYDAFLVYGLFLEVPRLDVRLSEALKTAALDEMVSSSLNFRFVKELSDNTQASVFYSASPVFAESHDDDAAEYPACHDFEETMVWIKSRYAHLRARCIEQPLDTLALSGLTLKHYSTGSSKLMKDESQSHSASDTRHMNNAYGEKFLDQAIPVIRCHSKSVLEM